MDTQERLEKLEKRMAELDTLLGKLVDLASRHPVGRLMLKSLGLG